MAEQKKWHVIERVDGDLVLEDDGGRRLDAFTADGYEEEAAEEFCYYLNRLETEQADLKAALEEIANPNGAAYGRASTFAREVLARLGDSDGAKP